MCLVSPRTVSGELVSRRPRCTAGRRGVSVNVCGERYRPLRARQRDRNSAGYRGETDPVFKGIIVKHRVRVRQNGSLLPVECRDEAVRMTTGRKSRYFTDKNDGDLLDELLGSYPLQRREGNCSRRQASRAVRVHRLGLPALPRGGQRPRRARPGREDHHRPAEDGRTSGCGGQVGATVLELDAEIDARWQARRSRPRLGMRPTRSDRRRASEPSVTASGNPRPTSWPRCSAARRISSATAAS